MTELIYIRNGEKLHIAKELGLVYAYADPTVKVNANEEKTLQRI